MSSVRAVTPSTVAPRGKDPARHVYLKLALFSVAMFLAPLMAYYFSRDRLFNGNVTYAGGLAALAANLVLFGYIVAAFLEDSDPDATAAKVQADKRLAKALADEKESRKDQ